MRALKRRKCDYLKICKNVQIEYKKYAFSMNHFYQNFHFFQWLAFSRLFGWNLSKDP